MWIIIDGIKVNKKSLNFSHLRSKLIDGTKEQTVRTLNIPYYTPREEIIIKFKSSPLFIAPVISYYPKRLNEIVLEEAKKDGFDTVKECIAKVMELNNIKKGREDHYCFLILWGNQARRDLEIVDKKGGTFVCVTQAKNNLDSFFS